MGSLDQIDIGGRDVAIQAARNFQTLRGKRITVRKTIDTLIATRCIEDGLSLLYSDRDFEPFVEHPGLASDMSREIGRASGRGSVCQYGRIAVVPEYVKKKRNT